MTSDDMAINVLQSFVEDPHSSRKVASQHDIRISSMCNILKCNNNHLYKMHLVYELSEDDFDQRIEYCYTLMEKLDTDPNCASNIIFSDEVIFLLNRNVN